LPPELEEAVNSPSYTMRQLQVFVAVEDAGTIRGAAQSLRVSESAIAAALNDLETALDVQLFVRRKAHGVTLTPSGESVLPRARALLAQAAELQAEASGGTGVLTGPLVIGCYPTLGPTILPALLSGFGARHPGVAVDFHEDTQDRLQHRLRRGELDLAILYDLDLFTGLRTVPLASRAPSVLLPSGHPLGSVPRLGLSALASEPMVLLDAPPSSSHALAMCRLAGFSPVIRFRTANFETARALVGRGLGWTLLVQRPHQDLTYEGLPLLVRTPDDPALPAVTVVAAWHGDVRLSRRASAFLAYAQSVELPAPKA
jgi:DNA-binding transcriptional LysR family regulator